MDGRKRGGGAGLSAPLAQILGKSAAEIEQSVRPIGVLKQIRHSSFGLPVFGREKRGGKALGWTGEGCCRGGAGRRRRSGSGGTLLFLHLVKESHHRKRYVTFGRHFYHIFDVNASRFHAGVV